MVFLTIPAQSRDTIIDIAKGLGIFLIIWGHTVCFWSTEIYAFHIPLFFILSGYFYKEEVNFVTFLRKKIKRLIVPYLFFSIFSYFFYLFWALIFTGIDTFQWNAIAKIIPYRGTVIAPLWFFISLFEVSMIYDSIFRFVRKKILLWIICMFALMIVYLVSPVRFPVNVNYFHFASSLAMLSFFAIGNLIFKPFRSRLIADKIRHNILVFLLVTVSFIVLSKSFKGVDVNGIYYYSSFFVFIGGAVLGSYLVFLSAWFISKVPYLGISIACVGRNTLGIFAIHFPMFELSRPVAGFFLTKNSYSWGVAVALICLIFSLFATVLLKNIFPWGLGIQTHR